MKREIENKVVHTEGFVTADEAASFLSMNRLRVIRAARSGRLPAHPFPRGRGNDWFFLKSELAAYMRGELKSTPRPFVVESETQDDETAPTRMLTWTAKTKVWAQGLGVFLVGNRH